MRERWDTDSHLDSGYSGVLPLFRMRWSRAKRESQGFGVLLLLCAMLDVGWSELGVTRPGIVVTEGQSLLGDFDRQLGWG